MPKYLFSNDQRISVLEDRIQWVANYVMSGKKLKDISGKSDNNNAATLEFYYNLYPNTVNTKVAITSPKEVIRNFVLKFQFPNPRTPESFYDSLSEEVYLAPYRMTISILLALAKLDNSEYSYLTLDEILCYVFADSQVCKNPSVNCEKLAVLVKENRKNNKDLSSFINANIEWKHNDRQIREMMMVLCKCLDGFHLSKGILEYSHTSRDDDFINKVIKYNYFWIPTNKDNIDLSNKEYISYMNMADTPYNVVEFNKEKDIKIKKNLGVYPLQQVYYGAPGTGKSFELKDITKAYSTIRTTFHPECDYSTFVGSYKPVMTECTVYGPQGEPIKISKGQEKIDLKENRITYTYVKQAFLKAYLGAWQKYAKGGDTAEPQFLVIEEINRGNCAQIFGDLFQLLDRSDNGFSSYPIEADSDLQKEIEAAFGVSGEYALENDFNVDDVVDDYTSNYDKSSLTDDIKSGRVLLLPNNLYIWATMNTSDQSLFPIDSAFKRRWDWKYVKIADAHKGWMIKCGNEACDWWTFVEAINKEIADKCESEDKKLGYFFCKPKGGEDFIDEERFVGKVLFFLWNDVFKDIDTSLFKLGGETEETPTFDAFYTQNEKGETIADTMAIRQFLVKVVGEDNFISDFTENSSTVSANGSPRFVLDGNGIPDKMMNVVRNIVQKYADAHPTETADGIMTVFNEVCNDNDFKITNDFILETEVIHSHRKAQKQKSERDVELDLGGRGKLFVNRYWTSKNREVFIRKAKEMQWGIIEPVKQ